MRYILIKKNSNLYKVLISHHPSCIKYKNHTIKIGNWNFCIGCYIGYPAGILALIIGYIFTQNNTISLEFLLFLGFILFSSTILRFFPISEIKGVKIIQKIMIGYGGGSILLFVYLTSLHSGIVTLFILNGVLSLLTIPLIIFHYNHFKITCQ